MYRFFPLRCIMTIAVFHFFNTNEVLTMKQTTNVIPLMQSRKRLLGVFGMIRKNNGEIVDLNGSAHSVHLYLECLHEVSELVSNDPKANPQLILEFTDGSQSFLRFDKQRQQFSRVRG